MNDKQKIVLICVGIIMLAMLLFPPFATIRAASTSINMGYAFIFSPPSKGALVNTGLLFFQWVVLTSIGFIAWLLFK